MRAEELTEAVKDSLQRAAAWLVRQQGEDGGWHSKTYGQLKDGAGVTALVVYALRHIPLEMLLPHAEQFRNGLYFIRQGIQKHGTICSPDGTRDFPTYATALWLVAEPEVVHPDDNRQKVVEYLVGAQVTNRRGFKKESEHYGGWDFLGPKDAQGITTGTNVSVTCYVLEGLAYDRRHSSRRKPFIPEALSLGKEYVLRCQQADGGFAFTCESGSLNNKALYADEKLMQPRAYGTATCDGIRALVACGMKATDEHVARGLAWVEKRPGLEVVPGFEGLPPEAGWQRGLRFYYYASLARVLPHLAAPVSSARREALASHVIGLQKSDGSWVNESDRMRENDPLIATSLAITALGELSRQAEAR